MGINPIIIYYTKTGTTAKLVEKVIPLLKAESRKLDEPKGLMDKLGELSSSIKSGDSIDHVSEFDPILLLAPVWDGKPAQSMMEFLEDSNLKGKRVIVVLVGANDANSDAL